MKKIALLLLLILTGCGATPPLPPWRTPAGPDFRLPGPHAAAIVTTTIDDVAVGDCRAAVAQFRPPDSAMVPPLVFAHGLLRENERHRDFARHLASWGVPVTLVGLCSGGWWNGGTALYAKLLNASADRLGAPRVVYGGFSAGGQASALAAAADARTIGYLGLDPVALSKSPAPPRPSRSAVPRPYPAYALFATSAACNARHAGLALIGGNDGDIARELPHTTHCHFEAPTNALCYAACGEPGDRARSDEVRGRIFALATAYLRWRAGLDLTAPQAWWRVEEGVLIQPMPTP